MKILQLGMGWFPEQAGGLNRYFYDSTHYLSLQGVEIKGLVTGTPNLGQETNGMISSFAASKSPMIQRFLGVRQGVKQLKNQKISLVASHFALYTFPILDLINKTPLICHFHGPWASEGSFEGNQSLATKLKLTLENRVYNQAKGFIVLSQAFGQILHQNYRIPSELIHVIPGGVDINRFNTDITKTEAKIKLDWQPDRKIIFVLRRLAKRMGLENLISSLDIVRRKFPDVLLLIAGKGTLKDNLQIQINELNLNNHVKLLGYLPDESLPLAYKAADFSVVPTVALEGFGLILLESLAAGTPVLATPVGGIPEVLKPLSEDLLFPGTTSNEITQVILEVLEGKRLLPTSKVCQDYVEANYNWSAIAEKIKTIYQSVL